MFKKVTRAYERIPAITAPLFMALFTGASLTTHMRRKASSKEHVAAKALPEVGLTKDVVAALPRTSYYANGRSMESMNVILIGTKTELRNLYKLSGWYEALPVSFVNLLRCILAIKLRMQFLHGPVTPLYVGFTQQGLAFQKPTSLNRFEQRHHMRLWKTRFVAPSGQPIWIGQASYDKGIKQAGSLIKVPIHEIDGDLDAERDLLRHDLIAGGGIDYGYIRLEAAHTGENGFGDAFTSDGRAMVVGVQKSA